VVDCSTSHSGVVIGVQAWWIQGTGALHRALTPRRPRRTILDLLGSDDEQPIANEPASREHEGQLGSATPALYLVPATGSSSPGSAPRRSEGERAPGGRRMPDSPDRLEVLILTLAAKYPHIPRTAIMRLVMTADQALADAPVQTFVPILVGRAVEAQIRHSEAGRRSG
jgi:hypothetical protein